MKVKTCVIKSLAYDRLLSLMDDELSLTDRIDDQHYEGAAFAIALMRAVDSGKKRLIIDLEDPVSPKKMGGP